MVPLAQLEEVRALVGRFETLLVTRTQLSEREGQARTLLDGHRGSQQRELDRQNCLLMHHNNRLSQLQTELDLSRADRLGWVRTQRPRPGTPTGDPYQRPRPGTPTWDPYQRP